MNKYIRFIWILCTLALGFTACDDDEGEAGRDNTGTAVAFATSTLKTMENATPLQIPVTLNNPGTQDVTVTLTIKSEEGAVENTHYVFHSKTITISAGNSIGYFFVDIVDDRDINPDRIFTVELTKAEGAAVAENGKTCRIVIQSDEGYPALGFKNTLMSVDEDAGNIEIPVIISKPYTEDVTFKFLVKEGGSALNETHFIIDDQQEYTISAGDTLVNIKAKIIDNDTVNEDVTFELRIIEASNAQISEIYQESKITIVNDEKEAYVSFAEISRDIDENSEYVWIPVKVDGIYKLPITVTFNTEDGTAKEGTDYVLENNELIFTDHKMVDSIKVKIIDNDVVNKTKTFKVNIESVSGALKAEKNLSATVYIIDNDVNMTTLYDDMLGNWTLSCDRGDFQVVLSAGDTPGEEEENYQKVFLCKISNAIYSNEATIRIHIDMTNGGKLKVTAGDMTKTGASYSDPYGACLYRMVFHYEGKEGAAAFDPDGYADVSHNDNYSVLTVDPEKEIVGQLVSEADGHIWDTYDGSSMFKRIVLKKNK